MHDGIPVSDADGAQIRSEDLILLIGAGSLPDIPDWLRVKIIESTLRKGPQTDPETELGTVVGPVVPLVLGIRSCCLSIKTTN